MTALFITPIVLMVFLRFVPDFDVFGALKRLKSKLLKSGKF